MLSDREIVVARPFEEAWKTSGKSPQLPARDAWEKASPVAFSQDWKGNHEDRGRETEVRLLWSEKRLFIRFRCRFRDTYVYQDKIGRRDELWMRDVAEIFIQTDLKAPRRYREFEIAPNGDWLDLEIADGRKSCLFCDMETRVVRDPEIGVWTAEMAIPMHCLTPDFHPGRVWRMNFFRIEGREPDRFYSAWRPTHTPKPNFHVPECFGELRFAASA